MHVGTTLALPLAEAAHPLALLARFVLRAIAQAAASIFRGPRAVFVGIYRTCWTVLAAILRVALLGVTAPVVLNPVARPEAAAADRDVALVTRAFVVVSDGPAAVAFLHLPLAVAAQPRVAL
eukprot:1064436-Prymnesium_polylepis.1